MYRLPHELPNDLKDFRKLRNFKKIPEMLDLMASALPPTLNPNFDVFW